MDEARRSITVESPEDGTVFIAGYQWKGRGRFPERRWVSEAGKDLLFTVIFRKNSLAFPFTRLPVISGYVVAKTLENYYDLEILLKWPNDILAFFPSVEWRIPGKLGGILCEAYREYLLVGVGINCNGDTSAFNKGANNESDNETRRKIGAISLKELTGKTIEIEVLLYRVLKAFKDTILPLGEAKGWKEEITKRLYLRETVTKVRLGGSSGEIVEGIIRGIGDDGELLFDVSGRGIVRVYSGEIIF